MSDNDLRDLLGPGAELPGSPELDGWAAADPIAVGRALAQLLAGRDDAGRVLTWLSLIPDGVRVAVVLAGELPRLRPLIFEAMIPVSREDRWQVATAPAVVSGYAAGEQWAHELVLELLDRSWADLDERRWARLAELLAADPGGALTERAGDMLARAEWARADPWPLHATGGKPPDSPWRYPELFGPDEPRVRRAAHETDELERVIGDGRWLGRLGRALPGCGVTSCCRPGLFEAELIRRGYGIRRDAHS